MDSLYYIIFLQSSNNKILFFFVYFFITCEYFGPLKCITHSIFIKLIIYKTIKFDGYSSKKMNLLLY